MNDGAIPTDCSVCGYKSILRFNICKECDDALLLTKMSKKHHLGCGNHSIYDVKYIKNLLKNKANEINKLQAENEKLRECIEYLWENEPDKTEMLDKIQALLEELENKE